MSSQAGHAGRAETALTARGDRLFARRRVLLGAGSVLLLPWLPRNAQAAVIAAVRVWPADDYTRVTLEHDNDLKFSHFVLDHPDRLVVDIEGIDLNATLRDLVSKIAPNDPYIRAVRVGQNKPHVVRLVIDLKQPVNPQVFSLDPVAQFRHRLIFDLYPLAPHDPLLALIDKPEQAAAGLPSGAPAPADAHAAAGADPIGDLARTHADSAPSPADQAAASAPGTVAEAPRPDAPIANAPRPDAWKPELSKPEAAKPDMPRDFAKSEPKAAGKPVVARLVTITIDPGHGGEDPGAVGRAGSYEKNVVLRIARRVKEKLDAEPNMRSMLTRDGDYFVPLPVRVQKARRVQADLFVSIHADAFITPQASGSSVFALSERGATSTAAQWLAKKENDADLIGGVNLGTKDRDLARVLLDLSTTAQINDSLKLGDVMLDHIGKVNRLHKASVEQAGFAVLKAPDIPSILIETAFISNPDEERRLNTPEFQERMADSIVSGIKRYFAKNPPLAKSKLASL